MGNPLQTIPNLPPAISLSGAEQLWINQAGVDRRTTVAALGLVGGGEGITVASYADLRASAFPATSPIVLTDPFKPGIFMPAPPVPPAHPFAHRDNGGTVIVDAAGQAWQRVYDERVNAAWFYNEPSGLHFLGDGSAVTITAADIAANPQWIGMPDGSGMYPVGTTWDYVCLQEWVYCLAAANSSPGAGPLWNVNGAHYLWNQPGYCPPGNMFINQQLVVCGTGLNIVFAGRQGTPINWQGNLTGTSNVGPGFNFNTLAYSYVYGFEPNDVLGVSNYLVALDHGSLVPGLATQANTLVDWTISGQWKVAPTSVIPQAGLAISPSGGGAQGDTQVFINLFVNGFFYDGVLLMGANIVGVVFMGGNIQSCYRRGINSINGSYSCFNTLQEMVGTGYFNAPQMNHITLDGADYYGGAGFGASDAILIEGTRSESMISVVDLGQHTTLVADTIVPAATMAGWSANNHYQIGSVITVPGAPYTMAMLVDDGGWPWFLSDPTSTTTHLINPNSPGWTANEWLNYGLWLRFSSVGLCSSGGVVSSDANSVTAGQPFSVSGSHLIKIVGAAGATQPNWAATTTYGRTLRNAAGWGFTTIVGSNVVTSAIFNSIGHPQYPAVGDWVCVCGGASMGGPIQSGPTMITALIGKIASITGNAATLTDALGNPVNAAVALHDGYGYWGSPITDGQLTWIPIDFNVIFGVQRGYDVSLPMGRAEFTGALEFAPPVPATNFIRNSDTRGNLAAYRNAGLAGFVSPQTGGISGAYQVPANVLQTATNVELGISGAVTLDVAPMGLALFQELTLVLVSGGAGGNIVTWGANVRPAAPTLTLGAFNTVTLVRLAWIGNLGGGAGAWYQQAGSGALAQ